MAFTLPLIGDFADLGLNDFQIGPGNARKIKAYMRTNLGPNDALIDVTSGLELLGDTPITILSNGTWSVDLLDTSSTDLNVEANTLQYELVVEYTSTGSPAKRVYRSGWFALTEADLELVDDVPMAVFSSLDLDLPSVTPSWRSAFVASMEAIATTSAASATSAAASADAAATIVGLTGEDAAVALLIDTPASDTATALSATYARKYGEQPWYLDAYTAFLKGWTFATGQGTAATTTTATRAAAATTLAVTSGAGFINGTVIVLGAGTATQQINKVASGGGTTTLTLTNPLTYAVGNGDAVTPLWADAGHLNGAAGWQAWARFIMEARRPDGTRVINRSGKVVMFGNSWMTPANQANYEAAVHAVYPGATVVMAGVSGNTSTLMLARFDTDVPADADFVVMPEPSNNDVQQVLGPQVTAANVLALVRKCWAIGAVPIFTGAVPLSDKLGASAQMDVDMRAIFARPFTDSTSAVLLARPEARGYGSVGYGSRALEADTGGNNVAIGAESLRNNTTGTSNVALGQYALLSNTTATENTAVGQGAMTANQTGLRNVAVGKSALEVSTVSNNTAVGHKALLADTTGASNTAVGRSAGGAITTGGSNTYMGDSAGQAPNFNAANASTTASSQTFVGAFAGQGSATQRDNVTAIGNGALVDADRATAIGKSASALSARSVALGADTTTTYPDQVQIGGRHVELVEMTEPAAPATNAARWYVKDNGAGKSQLCVRFATGAVQILATEP